MNRLLLLLAAALIIGVTNCTIHAQVDQQSNQPQPVETDQVQQLGLTPEQRERIRGIFEQTREERQTTNRRLREANIALNQALDAEQVDESLIDQRVNDVGAAQAAQIRLRIRTELQIRRELRPEQLAIWRRLRLRAGDVLTGRGPLNRRVIREDRQNRRTNILPRRNNP